MKEIYPLTIAKDRYGGCYSGGKWLAFNEEPYNVSACPFADDITCMMFWDSERKIGVGQTKAEAIKDLKKKLYNDPHITGQKKKRINYEN